MFNAPYQHLTMTRPWPTDRTARQKNDQQNTKNQSLHVVFDWPNQDKQPKTPAKEDRYDIEVKTANNGTKTDDEKSIQKASTSKAKRAL